jgi:hypothetical protein
VQCKECVTYFYDIAGVANENVVSNPDPDCVPPISEHDHVTPAVPQVDNAAKLDKQRYVLDHFSIHRKQKQFLRFLELRCIIRMVITMLKCCSNEI